MKYPAYRNTDILYVDPVWRQKAFDWCLEGLRQYVVGPLTQFLAEEEARWRVRYPNIVVPKRIRLWLVGSMVRGAGKLGSDWDINIATDDHNSQVIAKRWFYRARNQKALEDHSLIFQNQWGLKLQWGCVDPDLDDRTIRVDLETMLMHRRFDEPPTDYVPGSVSSIVYQPEGPTIDLRAFDPETSPAPPIGNYHLMHDRFDTGWLRTPWGFSSEGGRVVFPPGTKNLLPSFSPVLGANGKPARTVSEDQWPADEVERWKLAYGPRYTPYHREGTQLIEDVPEILKPNGQPDDLSV